MVIPEHERKGEKKKTRTIGETTIFGFWALNG